MRGWRQSLVDAVRANPKLSGTLAVEIGLLFLATLRARRGRSATMPPVEAVIQALPLIAAAAIGAPHIERATRRTKRSHS